MRRHSITHRLSGLVFSSITSIIVLERLARGRDGASPAWPADFAYALQMRLCAAAFMQQGEVSSYWLEWTLGIIAVLLLAGAMVVLWNIQLQRTVAARTQELRENNETLTAETAEKTLAQKKLSTLLSIADKLIAVESFNDIGRAIFSGLIEYDPEGKRGGKLSVYYDDLDLFQVEYLDHESKDVLPTNLKCALKDVRLFSRMVIDEGRTLVVDDTHGDYALSVDPTLKDAARSTLIFIPLYYKAAFVGIFSYSHQGPHSLDEQYINLFESIGKYASIAIGEIISKRRREAAEQALAASERKYRTLFDESQDMVFEATLDGRIIDINPAGIALLGYDMKEELLPLNIGADLFVDPEERIIMIRLLVKQGYLKDYEIRLRKRDGSVILLEVSSTVVRGTAGGAIDSYRGIARDVTLQKLLEEQVLHGQKMESLGTLAGGIAHEFNNVLAMILPSAEMIAAATDTKSKTVLYVQRIIDAANRGATIAKQLLVFARSEKSESKPVSLQRIVLEIASLLHHTISRDIEVKTDVRAEDSMILGESGLLHQATLNLALNAKDAMPAGGVMTLEVCEAAEGEVRHLFPHSEPGPYLVLRVTDTGVGMDETTRGRMFDPFFTTKEPGKGTGLGLSIVHGIVTNHRGYINVESEPKRGTVVSVYFPHLKSIEEEAGAATGASADGMENETILVIDDEETIREMLSDLLTHHGYTVLTASNGVEGMERFMEHHEDIRLILSDLGMPRMNGEQFFAAARTFDPAAKIIISTGYLNPGIKTKLLGLGVKDVVTKPYTTDMLLPILRRALESVD